MIKHPSTLPFLAQKPQQMGEQVWAVIRGQGEGTESSIGPWKTSSKEINIENKASLGLFWKKVRGFMSWLLQVQETWHWLGPSKYETR